MAVSATVKIAPWHESFAVLSIEIAFARSTGVLPFAATSQPAVCGVVTETLLVLQPLWAPSTVIAPKSIELTCTL